MYEYLTVHTQAHTGDLESILIYQILMYTVAQHSHAT